MSAAAYREAAQTLLDETGCTVRRWRTKTTGTAYVKSDDWGIEAPEPRGPVSFATFAHEVGHQMLHRHGSKQRWMEELEAWEYALEQFDRFGLAGKEKARADAAKCLVYAASKAHRRCSPDTAHAILQRFPDWVWAADASCAMVAVDLEEAAESPPAQTKSAPSGAVSRGDKPT